MSNYTFKTYENAIIVPDRVNFYMDSLAAVYTQEKKLIFSSVLRRHHAENLYVPYIEPMINQDIEAIYGGGLITQNIGHFILDSLPRLWFAKENPHLPIVWNNTLPYDSPLQDYHKEIFEILGIKNEHIFTHKPTRIKKLHIPASLYLFYEYETKEFFDFLGQYENKEVVPGKKVYLVREGEAKTRGYINNDEIEQYVIDNGYSMLYPTKISIKERLDEFSSAEEILAISASSLFPLLLLKNKANRLVVLPRLDFYSLPKNRYSVNYNLYTEAVKEAYLQIYKCKISSLNMYKNHTECYVSIEDLDYAINHKEVMIDMYQYRWPLKELELEGDKKEVNSRYLFYDKLYHIPFQKQEVREFLMNKALVEFCDMSIEERYANEEMVIRFYNACFYAMRSAYFAFSIEKLSLLLSTYTFHFLPIEDYVFEHYNFQALQLYMDIITICKDILTTDEIIAYYEKILESNVFKLTDLPLEFKANIYHSVILAYRRKKTELNLSKA